MNINKKISLLVLFTVFSHSAFSMSWFRSLSVPRPVKKASSWVWNNKLMSGSTAALMAGTAYLGYKWYKNSTRILHDPNVFNINMPPLQESTYQENERPEHINNSYLADIPEQINPAVEIPTGDIAEPINLTVEIPTYESHVKEVHPLTQSTYLFDYEVEEILNDLPWLVETPIDEINENSGEYETTQLEPHPLAQSVYIPSEQAQPIESPAPVLPQPTVASQQPEPAQQLIPAQPKSAPAPALNQSQQRSRVRITQAPDALTQALAATTLADDSSSYISQMPKTAHTKLTHYLYNPINFWDWKKACEQSIKQNNQKGISSGTLKVLPDVYASTPLTFEQFHAEIHAFRSSQLQKLHNKNLWVGNYHEKLPSFYVEKLVVQPDDIVALHGDMHGDILSLNTFLEFLSQEGYSSKADPFKIINPHFKLLFLGDYTDRGLYGSEVVFAIMHLKRLNPDQVFTIRGNHEDPLLCVKWGFKDEIVSKFKKEYTPDFMYTICEAYKLMPSALYLVCGNNAILCCHGGLEIGFNHTQELLKAPGINRLIRFDDLYRNTRYGKFSDEYKPCLTTCVEELKDHRTTIPTADKLGFMWSDFNFNYGTKEDPVEFKEGRGFIFPEYFTKYYLEHESSPEYNVRGIFRAHQHNPETMPYILNHNKLGHNCNAGVAKLWKQNQNEMDEATARKLWDGIVCTFSVSPFSNQYGDAFKYNFDTVGILRTAQLFENWDLQIHRLPIVVPK